VVDACRAIDAGDFDRRCTISKTRPGERSADRIAEVGFALAQQPIGECV